MQSTLVIDYIIESWKLFRKSDSAAALIRSTLAGERLVLSPTPCHAVNGVAASRQEERKQMRLKKANPDNKLLQRHESLNHSQVNLKAMLECYSQNHPNQSHCTCYCHNIKLLFKINSTQSNVVGGSRNGQMLLFQRILGLSSSTVEVHVAFHQDSTGCNTIIKCRTSSLNLKL